jgi:hypothetical protein
MASYPHECTTNKIPSNDIQIYKIFNISLPSRLYSSKNVLNIADADHRRDKATDFHMAAVHIAAVDTVVVVYVDAAVDTAAAADREVAGLDKVIPAAEHKVGIESDLAVEAVEAAKSLGMADHHSVQSLPSRSFAWPKNPAVHRFHRCLVSPSFAP